MYNKEQKSRFLKQYTNKASTTMAAESVFNTLEPYESRQGIDLCAMSTSDLQEPLNQLCSIRRQGYISKLCVLREYAKWCIDNGVPGACDSLMKIKYTDISLDKMKLRTVSSPAHLQWYLDKLLAPTSDKTTDCIYRCWLWLAFCGLEDAEIYNVRCSDVNLEEMTVKCGYDEYPLYRESFQAFRICATSDHFAHGTPGTPGYRLVPRVEGDYLVRGVKSRPTSKDIQIVLSRKSSDKFGKDGMRISSSRARLSGIFYRMYERERMGIPVDFSDIVDEMMAEKEYSLEGTTITAIRNKYIKEYIKDYERWKAAYSN